MASLIAAKQSEITANRNLISNLEAERNTIRSEYGFYSKEFQNWRKSRSANNLRVAYGAKTRLNEELKNLRMQERGYSGQDPYGRRVQESGYWASSGRPVMTTTTAQAPGVQPKAGPGTTSLPYAERYGRVGITRSEWAAMTPSAREAVAAKARSGQLRRAGEIDRTKPLKLTVVDAKGRPMTEYVATTDYEAGTRTLTKRDVREFYPDFSTGREVRIDRYRPSMTPFQTAQIENAALGTGFTPWQETITYGEPGPKWLPEGNQTREQVSTTSMTTRSGAMSQLVMMGEGKSFAEAYKYGYGPVTVQSKVTTSVRSEPSERDYQRRSQLGAVVGLKQTGRFIEEAGEWGIDQAQMRYLQSESAARRGVGGVMYGVGKAEQWTGQFVTGTGEFIAKKPVQAVAAFGVGTAYGATTKALGTWAAVTQKTGPVLASFGLKGLGALAGGYWAAGEAEAISESERPGERAAETAGIAYSFIGGARIGAGAVPAPSITGVRTTSIKGVTTIQDGTLTGGVTKTGSVRVSWLGKNYKVPFTAMETYAGGKLSGTVKFAGQKPYTYSGSTVGFDVGRASIVRGPVAQQSTIYTKGGVERSTLYTTGLGNPKLITGTIASPSVRGDYFGTTQNIGFIQKGQVPTRGWLTYATGGAAGDVTSQDMFSGLSIGRSATTGGFALPSTPGGIPFTFTPASILSRPVITTSGITTVFGLTRPVETSKSQSVFAGEARSFFSSRSVSFPAPEGLSLSTGGADTISDPGAVSDVLSTSTAGSSSSTASDFTSTTSTATTVNIFNITEVPWGPGAPPVGVALPFGGGWGRRGKRRDSSPSFRTRYNPSIAAEIFKIKGTRRQGRAAARTGISVRPIL